MKETIVGRWEKGAASSDITTIASGTQETRQGVREEHAKSLVLTPAVLVLSKRD